MNPTSKFETISPEKAKLLLENNKNNRPVNEANLNFISSAMSKSKFKLTGESIKIAQDGSLLDGQHRLLAIIKSGVTLQMLVIRGLDNEAFKYIDTGKNRSAGDVLAIQGISNSPAISTIVNFIVQFKRGKYYAAGGKVNRREKLSNADISDFVNKNIKQLQESFKYGFCKDNKIVSRTHLAAFHYIFNEINDVAADFFCYKLAEGSELKSTSPIYLLRQKLIQDIRSTRKMSALEKIALICKSWNAYRSNKNMTLLRWDSIKEAFPKPI